MAVWYRAICGVGGRVTYFSQEASRNESSGTRGHSCIQMMVFSSVFFIAVAKRCEKKNCFKRGKVNFDLCFQRSQSIDDSIALSSRRGSLSQGKGQQRKSTQFVMGSESREKEIKGFRENKVPDHEISDSLLQSHCTCLQLPHSPSKVEQTHYVVIVII